MRVGTDRREFIRLRWERGLTAAAIADELEITVQAVYAHLEALGIDRSTPRFSADDPRSVSTRGEVEALLDGGVSVAKIAAQLGISRQMVYKHKAAIAAEKSGS